MRNSTESLIEQPALARLEVLRCILINGFVCVDALDVLKSKRLLDGGFLAEKAAGRSISEVTSGRKMTSENQ